MTVPTRDVNTARERIHLRAGGMTASLAARNQPEKKAVSRSALGKGTVGREEERRKKEERIANR